MGKEEREIKIHPTAIVSKSATIGKGTVIWAFAQVMDNAVIGENCMIGNGAYIDRNVRIGNNVKIHNKTLLYDGLIVEDNVFIGPGVCFTNDKYPASDKRRDLTNIRWYVKEGSSIGANVTVLPDVNIGKNARIGAGAVVTKDVPEGAIYIGPTPRIK